VILTCPTLRFAVHEDGAIERLSTWFPSVAFDQDLLARADGKRLRLRGDELEIHCTNGGATYALGLLTNGIRVGRLARAWEG